MIDGLTLNDGRNIPRMGIGLWQVPQAQTVEVVRTAVDLGYRLIDGAFIYGNEAEMGEGIRSADISRDDLFVTTKVWNTEQGYDSTRRAVEGSLARIGVGAVDLCLIHWPCPAQGLYVETWKALIELQAEGRLRSIGVSNFNPDHLDRIIGETGVTPAVNQIELNPRLQQAELRAANAARGIVTQSWTPLGHSASFDAPAIRAICARTGATPAQVILRWHLLLDVSVIPRSSRRAHMAANFAAFDLDLSQAEMAAIAGLDVGVRTGPDPAHFT